MLFGAEDGQKTYKNEIPSYSFFYPSNWLLVAEPKADYVDLLSPETKQQEHNSLDIQHGIKLEFVSDLTAENFKEKLEKEKFSECGSTNDATRITFCSESEDMIFVVTGLKGDKTFVVAFGFIPEKEKKAEYLKQYLQIIESFTFTPKE